MHTVTGHCYIAGRWIEPAGEQTVAVVNPATGEPIGTVRDCSPAQIAQAVATARTAQESWALVDIAERVEVVRRIRAGLEEHREALAQAMSQEMGAPITAARTQAVNMAIADADGFLGAWEQLALSEQVGPALVVREPVGVVAAITPWNAPLHQISLKLLPALIAGCSVVLKPSEVTPSAAELYVAIAAQAGVPAGVLNLVTGRGNTVGQALVEHPDIDMVSFTGSVPVGKAIGASAIGSLKRVALELGGKSACIVLDDADLSVAIPSVVGACMRNNGQVCVATTRLLVPRERLAEAERVAADVVAGSWQPADPADEATTLGPVANRSQFERVTNYIARGVAEGARVVSGGPGADTGMDRGFFVAPTVFGDVDPQMTIAQEEIFGPVLSIIGYDDEEDALRIANGTRYGLAASVWSADEARARRVAGRLRAGVVRINGGGSELGTPFGGYKESGIGREGGIYGLEEYFELKTLSAPSGVSA